MNNRQFINSLPEGTTSTVPALALEQGNWTEGDFIQPDGTAIHAVLCEHGDVSYWYQYVDEKFERLAEVCPDCLEAQRHA